MPADRAGEAQVTRWCFAAMSTIEPPLPGLMVHDWTMEGGDGRHRELLAD